VSIERSIKTANSTYNGIFAASSIRDLLPKISKACILGKIFSLKANKFYIMKLSILQTINVSTGKAMKNIRLKFRF
jgi:hypothetical protein